jgi:hypothetical protein
MGIILLDTNIVSYLLKGDTRAECRSAGRPISPQDAWIAATALQHDLERITLQTEGPLASSFAYPVDQGVFLRFYFNEVTGTIPFRLWTPSQYWPVNHWAVTRFVTIHSG